MKDFKNKAKAFFQKAKGKILGVCTAVGAMAISAVSAFAADPGTVDVAAELAPAIKPVQDLFTFSNVVKVLGIVIGGCALMFLLWWGLRKIVKMVKNGLKGKLSV